jgi:hypothetical protein
VQTLTTQSALRSSHGSASPYDLHAVLIANGPSFRSGLRSILPTGAVDLAPTVAALLGLEAQPSQDGRVLWELMAGPAGEPGPLQEELLEPVTTNGFREARLLLHRVGTTSYLHGALQEDAHFPVHPEAGVGR